MKLGLDSAIPPSAAQVQAAKAAGVAMWSGYLSEIPQRDGLYRPWTPAEFAVVKALNPHPIAFTSGWDDPAASKADAVKQGLRLCLDVERLIRDNGPWVQPWLDESGAGLYGVQAIHTGRRAAFHIAAWYPGYDPKRTWPSNWLNPATPCGWQFQNTHVEFGVGVDRSWLDNSFGGADMLPGEFFDTCVREWFLVLTGRPVDETKLLPNNVTEFANWRAQFVADGSNMGAIFLGLFKSDEAAAYRAHKPAGATLPPGTKLSVTVD